MSIAAGTRLGRYEISSQLGAGGMGEVYLAEDVNLRRPVALKILPARFTESEDRLRRFEREASAASALNHPNIITIHEIGQQDGVHFLAMEFVDGETLRARLSRAGMTLKEALHIAVQIADALAAAHEAGIVHRDIKPENVMLRRDGYVKVLDFGLAKLTERQGAAVDSQAPTIAKADTDPGTVMGTMQYMSPEQARGLHVDARTDIFSLGCVLYEMLTGRVPFEGETTSDIIVSLLSQEPAALSSEGEVPWELERIVRKALQKSRDERYQTIKDMALDLKSLRRELEVEAELERSISPVSSAAGLRATRSGAHTATPTTKDSRVRTSLRTDARRTSAGDARLVNLFAGRRRLIALGVIALLVAAAIIFALYKFLGQNRDGDNAAGLFQQPQVTKLTTNGSTHIAAISPDGKYVAYAMDEGGKQSLWLRQVAISSNVRLLPLAEVQYYACMFSADGDFIYYAVGTPGTPPSIYKLPVLGGSPTKVMGDLTGPIALSPDGRQLAIVTIDRVKREVTLSVSNLDRTGERKLMSRKAPEFFDWVAWSPDGQSIACPISGFEKNNSFKKIVEVRVSDGSEKEITTQPWVSSGQIVWLQDKSGLAITARRHDSSFDRIWLISYASGEARSITNDLNDYRGISISADSSALVSVQVQTLANLWISRAAQEHAEAAQLTPGVGTYYDLAGTSDGKLLYASDASGSADIWEMEADGTNKKQLTAGAGRNYAPAATPDNRHLVFHSDRSGTWQIWRMARDGSDPRQLTFDTTESTWPQVSPDGQWVIYQHVDSTSLKVSLWKVKIDGGEAVRLTDQISLRPAISPDGKWIACWQYRPAEGGRIVLVIIPSIGGRAVKEFELTPNAVAEWNAAVKWTPDGRALSYVDQREGVGNVWKQMVDGGAPTQLTDFKINQILSFDWLKDGRLICSRGFQAGDAVLIKDSH